MIQVTQIPPSVPPTLIAAISQWIVLLVPVMLAYLGYKQALAKKVSDSHTAQIQEVKGLVNGTLGQTLQVGLNSAQTGLTAAKALAVVAPDPENIALADVAKGDAAKAQIALDTHNATQDAINASIAAGTTK